MRRPRATRHNPQISRRVRGVRSVAVLAVVALAMTLVAGLFGGCSGEKRYKVLSLFFDGVPNPDAPVVASAEGDSEFTQQRPGGAAGAPKMLAIVHKPYADNQCNDCHSNTTGRFDDYQKLDSTICLKCHDNVRTKYPVMHGPVSVGECNLCHVPHESTTPALLKENNSTLCTQCHQTELLSSTPREHLTPDKNSCLDCHSGHGGPKHGLLKPRKLTATSKPVASTRKSPRGKQPPKQPAGVARGGESR
jgi:predicted CXXCH cytochrome family protein